MILLKKSNSLPNFGGKRLNNRHETLIIATKNKNSKFTFNYKTGKFINGGKQMGSVWTFLVCSGNERIKD
ncbi:DNA methyltransferase [Mycoplasmopsis columbina]|uniref:Type II m6A methylase n=1 Tax=Mycoplasmopsis columbina SF7 TaxID=1037410 RepID=F9UKE4_9BACT|nr:DNA methyltransferase [Mycoplasmopsis columbina]EGV00149.1 type II m6A methylase [Mycoplasmopsis columbina SF7]